MLAGVSAETSPMTVMEVFSGSGFSGGSCCAAAGQIARTDKASIVPTRLLETLRGGCKDNPVAALIRRRFRGLPIECLNQSEEPKDSIDVSIFREAKIKSLRTE